MEKNLRKLIRSVYTGLGTKVVGFSVQLLGLPLVAHQLGPERFALFLIAIGVPSFVLLAQVGAGPSLTRRVATAAADSNSWDDINTYIGASMTICSALAAAILFTGLAVLYQGWLGNFLGAGAFAEEMRFALYISLLLSVFALITTPLLRAQIGLHEAYVSNIASAGGGVLALVMLFLLLPRYPSIPIAVLAYYGGTVITSLTSTSLFVFMHRSEFRFRLAPGKARLREAFSDGFSFTTFEGAQALSREGSKLLLLKGGEAAALAVFGGLSQVAMVIRAAALMVAVPGMAYVSQLFATGKQKHCRQILWAIVLTMVVSALLLAALAVYQGENVFNRLYPTISTPGSAELAIAAVFAVMATYKSLLMLFSTALGCPWASAIASVVEALLTGGAMLGFYGLGMLTSCNTLIASSTAIFLMSGIWLTWKCHQTLANE